MFSVVFKALSGYKGKFDLVYFGEHRLHDPPGDLARVSLDFIIHAVNQTHVNFFSPHGLVWVVLIESVDILIDLDSTSHWLSVRVDRAPDTDLHLSRPVQVINVINVAHPGSYLVFFFNKWVFLIQIFFLIWLLSEVKPGFVDVHGFFHETLDAVDGVVIQGLVHGLGFAHRLHVQDVLLVPLVNEDRVLELFDDYVPREHRLGGSHQRSHHHVCREDVCFAFFGQSFDHGVGESVNVEHVSRKGWKSHWLDSSRLVDVSVVLVDFSGSYFASQELDLNLWQLLQSLFGVLVEDRPLRLNLDRGVSEHLSVPVVQVLHLVGSIQVLVELSPLLRHRLHRLALVLVKSGVLLILLLLLALWSSLVVALSFLVLFTLLILVSFALDLYLLLDSCEVFVVIFRFDFFDLRFLSLVFLLLAALRLVGLNLVLLLGLQGEVTYLPHFVVFVVWLVEF